MHNKGNAQPEITLQQSARWLPADMDTPISLFMGMVGQDNGILLESAEVDGRSGRYSILACDAALFIACRDGNLELTVLDERLTGLQKFAGRPFVQGLRALMRTVDITPPSNVPDLPPITRALYGYLGFGMAGLFNPKLARLMPPEEADCQLMLPSTVLVFDHLYNRLCQVSLGDHRALQGARQPLEPGEAGQGALLDPQTISAEPGEQGYKDFVRRIKEMLRQGEAIQVVPSVRFPPPSRAIPLSSTGACGVLTLRPTCFICAFRKSPCWDPRRRSWCVARRGSCSFRPLRARAGAGPTIWKTPAWPPNCTTTPRSAPSTSCWWTWAATTWAGWPAPAP